MTQDVSSVLTLNGGSSSIKFALYQTGEPLKRGLHGKVDRIGSSGTKFVVSDPAGKQLGDQSLGQLDHRSAAMFLLDWLEKRVGLASFAAIGHRVVNGGPNYLEAQLVTDAMLDQLRRVSAYAPEHLPAELDMIDLVSARVPRIPQVACFDTAFHRAMPRVAKILPIPRRLQAKGVERYGFHGLSYTFLMEELARVAGTDAARGRVILAHLGNAALASASECSVRKWCKSGSGSRRQERRYQHGLYADGGRAHELALGRSRSWIGVVPRANRANVRAAI